MFRRARNCRLRNPLLHIALGSAAALLALGGAALAQDGTRPSIQFELNKLESRKGACRLYFVINNRSAIDIGNLRLDIFVFDKAQIIARRAAIATRRLRPGKTYIRLFEIPDLSCASFGRIVVNEVLSCVDAAKKEEDCEPLLHYSSRAGVPFVD